MQYRASDDVRRHISGDPTHPDHEAFQALNDYALHGHDKLNRALREPINPNLPVWAQGNDWAQGRAARIDAALDKIRSVTGNHHGDTIRGMDLPAKTLAEWEAAGAVRNKSYWSTTHNPDVVHGYTTANAAEGKVPVTLRLKQKSGVPIGGSEGEVIIPRDKNWMIRGSKSAPDGGKELHLEEVDSFPEGIVPAIGVVRSGERDSYATQAAAVDDLGKVARPTVKALEKEMKAALKAGDSKRYGELETQWREAKSGGTTANRATAPRETSPRGPSDEELLSALNGRTELADLRERFSGVPRNALDAQLKRLQQEGHLVLSADDSHRTLWFPQRQTDAALDIAGAKRHIVYPVRSR